MNKEEFILNVEKTKLVDGKTQIRIFSDEPNSPASILKYKEEPEDVAGGVTDTILKLIDLHPISEKYGMDEEFHREVKQVLPAIIDKALKVGTPFRIFIRWVEKGRKRTFHSVSIQKKK